jgi:hypothetical protein
MNRVLGDYLEKLLYKVFVSIDEHTTVAELAQVLRVNLQNVKDAVSMYCRLGFASKKNVSTVQALNDCHPSWHVDIHTASIDSSSSNVLLTGNQASCVVIITGSLVLLLCRAYDGRQTCWYPV